MRRKHLLLMRRYMRFQFHYKAWLDVRDTLSSRA